MKRFGRRDGSGLGLLRAWVAAPVGLLVAYTAATVLVPAVRVAAFSPDLRLVVEVVGLCVALFAAMALLLPSEERPDPATNAFVAALLVLGASNAVAVVGPVLLDGEATTGRGYGFYPWLAARYVAGLLFILAGCRPPRLGLGVYLLASALVLAVADTTFLVLGDRLPLPLVQLEQLRGGMTVDLSSAAATTAVAAVPGVLFAAGAWLAWRVHLRTRTSIWVWLSLALWVQVLAQVQELLYPAVLGPVITSADVLRAVALAVLLAGALLAVRDLFHSRAAALRGQAEDLRTQEELLATLREFTEREEAFRAVVVHELATPIATLRGFARLLTDARRPLPPGDRDVALAGIESEARRLAQLATRMEELRSLELDGLRCDLRPLLLGPLLDDAAVAARALPGHHTVTASSDPVRVHGDPVRLGQALRNLLANAARYAPDRTPIVVEGRCLPGGLVHVCVTDQGPGVAPADRERLLGRYERAGATPSAEGAGLGLYVARRVAQAHGGRLWLTDPPEGPGTRAVLELRRA